MASKLLLLSLQALVVSATPGFVDALNYHPRAPLPTGFQRGVEKRQDINACSYVYNAINFCESVSPGFTTMAETNQAPCLCYSSTAWMPGVFDGAVETCASFARTASPTDYSALNALDGFCTSIGNVAAAQPTAAPTACSVVVEAISYCNSISPGFTTMPVSDQAPCLCYSSRSWVPEFFDGQVKTCADFASSASPSDYSVLQGLQGFCTSAGNVLAPAATPGTTTTPRSTPVITAPPTTRTPTSIPPVTSSFPTNSDCNFVLSTISFCESISPGFTTMEPSSQAPCLCYSSNTWRPEGFDGPVSSCASFVRTASPEDYSIFSNLAGFCTDVGDVTAQATGTGTGGSGGVSGGVGAGIGATGVDFPRSSQTQRTTTVFAPEPTTSSSNTSSAGVQSAFMNHWALKLVSIAMCMFALL